MLDNIPAIIPIGDTVLVRQHKGAEKTEGGLFLPDIGRKKPKEGTVLAVGKGRRYDGGVYVPPDVATGERVMFKIGNLSKIDHDGEELLVIDSKDLLVVWRD